VSGEIGWKVGGKQGEGIDSTGEIFAVTLHRMGYYVFTYRHFMSLIKGGHTNYKIRAATHAVRHHGDKVDVLVAFDQTSIDHNWKELSRGSVVVYDSSSFEASAPTEPEVHLCRIPLTDLAKQAGNPIMKNMVAIGVSAYIHQLDLEEFRPVIEDKFGRKGQSVVESNMEALKLGYEFFRENYRHTIPAPAAHHVNSQNHRLFLSGNQATGFGALAGGCRFLAAYPITPATEIMYWLIAHMPQYGGVVVQAEDEIAAVNMAIGANFAGVRAMTSTSGPGFSLMMEALGLAGMSETPLVIVDVQRSGPSTGLPTKTEQSDLYEAVFGTHGETERIVLTPRTVEECFSLTAEAFNLADVYQCPVIVMTDLYTGMNAQSVDELPVDAIRINRGKRVSDDELKDLKPYEFKRYNPDVADGISPRSIPGQKNGRYVALGNEHNEIGIEVEDVETRIKQVKKRKRKLESFSHYTGVVVDGKADASFALIGFGSTWGVLKEVREALEQRGVSVKHIHFNRIAPFPAEALEDAMQGVSQGLVVELNPSGQLRQLMQLHGPYHDKLISCLKFDGDPISFQEIYDRALQVFPSEVLR
jgi:2-oxoglutarate/2-oxoacid ferredoxin oxidoreductase subunit alpha